MRRRASLVVLVCALQAGCAWASDLADMAGRWRTVRHGALVDIGDCGDGTPCGWLAWVKPELTDGHTQDVRNLDPSLRGRRLIGVPILWGFAVGPGGWRDGRLYNPDDGKTFRAHLKLLSATELRVTGCIGPLCLTQVWTRHLNGQTTGGLQ